MHLSGKTPGLSLRYTRTALTHLFISYVVVFLIEAKLIVFSPLNLQWTKYYFCSNFSELFDTDWFITFLLNDVSVVKHLPNLEGKFVAPYTLRVPRKCTPKCYKDRVLPKLVRKRVSLNIFSYSSSKLFTCLSPIIIWSKYNYQWLYL